jgi:hypothetical protein
MMSIVLRLVSSRRGKDPGERWTMKRILTIAVLFMGFSVASRAQMKVDELVGNCRAVAQAETADMRRNDIGPIFVRMAGCGAYIKGWAEAMDGSVMTEKEGSGHDDGILYTFMLKRANLPSNFSYVGKAVVKYVDEHPLDGDKSAPDILFEVFLSNQLAVMVHRGSLTCTPTVLPNP